MNHKDPNLSCIFASFDTPAIPVGMGSFNNYVDKMRREGVQKMSVFVHAQGKNCPD